MGHILGVDEVGRGAWAGPLVVGAVILGDYHPEGLTDSKLVNKKDRELLADLIYKNAVSVGLGWVEPDEIDKIGLTAATTLGIKRAIKGAKSSYDEIIIDGSINYLPGHPKVRCLIKADLSVQAVSAASIVAKVARDNFMAGLGVKHPLFSFEKHVGYGTSSHRLALEKYGLTPFHRRSFKPMSLYGAA